MRRCLFLSGLAALAVAGCTASCADQGPSQAPERQNRARASVQAAGADAPNFVVILTDDMRASDLAYMPLTRALVGDAGMAFDSAYVSYSLCCPSRATLLTGEYPHNHGVRGNRAPAGGLARFQESGGEAETIAVWLQRAGYRTALFGKYLNGYLEGGEDEEQATFGGVPPGWDVWAGTGGSGQEGYANYAVNEDGRLVRYGSGDADYPTDVQARQAVAFIRDSGASGRPFFLHLTPWAPHDPAVPARRHAGKFAHLPLPQPPGFNEADVSDKPAWLRNRAPLKPGEVDSLGALYRRRLESLQAVDEMVAAVVAALAETGQLERTVIVFTSDNGFKLGEHRLDKKKTAYEEDTRVPLLVRGPGVAVGRTGSLALNNDLAPTLLALAGLPVPASVDGRSLAPALRGGALSRTGLLVEGRKQLKQDPATFWALRTHRYLYVEYGGGERELYDTDADPYQLQNLAGTADPALLTALSARVAALRACKGAACRAAEDR